MNNKLLLGLQMWVLYVSKFTLETIYITNNIKNQIPSSNDDQIWVPHLLFFFKVRSQFRQQSHNPDPDQEFVSEVQIKLKFNKTINKKNGRLKI